MAVEFIEFGNKGMISVAWQAVAHNFSYIHDEVKKGWNKTCEDGERRERGRGQV